MKRRSLLFFLILVLAGWVFVPAAHAQAFNPIPGPEEFGAIVDQKSKDGQMSKEVYTVNTQAYYMNTATCMIVGCSTDPNSPVGYSKSAIASISNVVIAMYANPPADLALWIKDTGQILGFAPKLANAQGIGFSGLSPLLPIWKAFRNIAYALLAVIMIVIGFMVMFRKKIDPKTVVTAQNALPKIVLTLLLITFSYAIVGLMIDLMYLTIALIAALLIPVGNGALGAETGSKYLNGGMWNLFAMVFTGGFSAFTDITTLITPWGGTSFIGTVASLAFGPSVLVFFILALFVIITFIRILFMLLSAYVQIIISLLIGPLQILTEALPGSNGFSSWLKSLLGNIAVFPIAAAIMMLATVLGNVGYYTNGTIWTPPLLSGGTSSAILGLIGLMLLSQIPNFARAFKEAIKTKPLVGGGGGFGAVGGLAMQAYQVASMMYSSKLTKSHIKSMDSQTAALRDSRTAGETGKTVDLTKEEG